MTDSKVSVVIPAHNAEPFLGDAIDAVLGQSVPVELLVVNDGSTDGTAAVIASYGSRIRHVTQEQRGLGAARNRGIDATSGEWIAFLDADDVWLPDKLSLQLRAAAADPQLEMIFGHCVEFDPMDVGWPARSDPFSGTSASAMLARRSLFDRIGGFDEGGQIGEFIDWYSRALHAGARSLVLQDLLFRRRVHAANMTRQATGRHDRYLDLVRAHVERRRGQP